MRRVRELAALFEITVMTAIIGSTPGQAATLTMTCKNPPSADYVVSFNTTTRSFTVTGWDRETKRNETTKYTVLAVESTPTDLLVTGLTVNDGPNFRAHFRPDKEMEYFENSKLFQTNTCR